MFKLKNKSDLARRGEIKLHNGIVQTPFFMPIATQAAVKLTETSDLDKMGAEIILSNTYHLHLRPGEKLIRDLGGLHNFMNWERPILTDSGGFQVFSLTKLRNIKEEGVYFNSHISGEKIFLSPEKVIEIEGDLGVDIAMVLDECPPYPCDKKYALDSLERTTRWASRCIDHHKKLGLNPKQKLFAIVQGSTYEDLRKMSCEQLIQFDFDGYAIGGLAVGEPNEKMYKMLDVVCPLLPEDKPRYLMGVGTPENILEAVERGVDMFDCVIPTRNARHGKLYTSSGEINIKNAKYAKDKSPVDDKCKCEVCSSLSRAYLRHLFQAGEMIAMRYATIHNLHFYLNLMKDIRSSIEEGRFAEFKKAVNNNCIKK